VLAALELSAVAARPVSELSYAERKLVEFARAMVADVQLVLLDEPTAGVALEERREVIARMHDHMRRRGVAAIVVEHDMSVIQTLSTHVYVLEGGRLIASGSFDDVVSDARVREAYLG
jgi:branched-chain amino acid transport system ATP-binding protein